LENLERVLKRLQALESSGVYYIFRQVMAYRGWIA